MPGLQLRHLDMEWRKAEIGGVFQEAYFTELAAKIDAFRAMGQAVVLGLGLHYTPADVTTIQPMIDNKGNVGTKANLVFSQTVRDRVERYIRALASRVNLNDNVYAVRIATAAGQGEIQYETQQYWAFSTGAQNGADAVVGMAPNPLPLPWKPGTSSTPTAQVLAWSKWYIKALASSCEFQCDILRDLGYRGWLYWICAGLGERPSRWTTDINFKLTGPSDIGRGVAWVELFGAIEDKTNVVLYTSSLAQSTASWSVTQPGDYDVPITSTVCDSWPAGRWMARVAHEYGLPIAGENPGKGNPADPTYANVMMDRMVEQAEAAGYQAIFWAHEDQLTEAATSAARFASLMSDANGGAVPVPTYPGAPLMAVTATLSTDKSTYAKGEVITATYEIQNAAAVVSTVTGHATVNGQAVPSSAVVTVESVLAFGAPTADGLTFTPTADPKVWKATA